MHGHRNYNLHHQLIVITITIALSNPPKKFMEDSKPVKSLGQCQPDIFPVGNYILIEIAMHKPTNQQSIAISAQNIPFDTKRRPGCKKLPVCNFKDCASTPPLGSGAQFALGERQVNMNGFKRGFV